MLKSQPQPVNFDNKHKRTTPSSHKNCREGTFCAKHYLDSQNVGFASEIAAGKWSKWKGISSLRGISALKSCICYFFHVFNSQALNTSLAAMISSIS